MYVVTLTFSENKARAADLMEAHKAWIQRGFDEGLFLMVGSCSPTGAAASWRMVRTWRTSRPLSRKIRSLPRRS